MPSNSLQTRFGIVALAAMIMVAGCAKFPATTGPRTTRLIFTMNVAGAIRTGQEPGGTGVPYIYMVALRTSTEDNPTTQGPVPVVSPPWGNGFVAGNATHFVWFDPTQANDFLVYKFQDTNLNNYFATGVPVSVENVSGGATRIRFELDLTQIADTPLDAENLRSLQVNFLTMDRIPQTGNSKQWDALGDTRLAQLNEFIRIPLRTSGIYSNQNSGNIEPAGDQVIPDLDITNWQVEVRLE